MSADRSPETGYCWFARCCKSVTDIRCAEMLKAIGSEGTYDQLRNDSLALNEGFPWLAFDSEPFSSTIWQGGARTLSWARLHPVPWSCRVCALNFPVRLMCFT